MPTATTKADARSWKAADLVKRIERLGKAAENLADARTALVAAARQLHDELDNPDVEGLSLESLMDVERRLEWIIDDLEGRALTVAELRAVREQVNELLAVTTFYAARAS